MRDCRNARRSHNDLDIVVRLHDAGRQAELQRCLFSLVCQSYRPLNIYIITQRFQADGLMRVQASVAAIGRIDTSACIHVVNYNKPGTADARAALLNLGIHAGRGRYLGFLDYDDIIHEGAYAALVGVLQASAATAAFGRVRRKFLEVHRDTFMCVSCSDAIGHSLTAFDQFKTNQCPIHSFIIDRNRLNARDLNFDEVLMRLEDYDFLIRLFAKYPTRFCGDTGPIVGDYNIKNDGSNSVLHGIESRYAKEDQLIWQQARTTLEQRRRRAEVSVEVQRSLNMAPLQPGLTMAQAADMFADGAI